MILQYYQRYYGHLTTCLFGYRSDQGQSFLKLWGKLAIPNQGDKENLMIYISEDRPEQFMDFREKIETSKQEFFS